MRSGVAPTSKFLPNSISWSSCQGIRDPKFQRTGIQSTGHLNSIYFLRRGIRSWYEIVTRCVQEFLKFLKVEASDILHPLLLVKIVFNYVVCNFPSQITHNRSPHAWCAPYIGHLKYVFLGRLASLNSLKATGLHADIWGKGAIGLTVLRSLTNIFYASFHS